MTSGVLEEMSGQFFYIYNNSVVATNHGCLLSFSFGCKDHFESESHKKTSTPSHTYISPKLLWGRDKSFERYHMTTVLTI